MGMDCCDLPNLGRRAGKLHFGRPLQTPKFPKPTLSEIAE